MLRFQAKRFSLLWALRVSLYRNALDTTRVHSNIFLWNAVYSFDSGSVPSVVLVSLASDYSVISDDLNGITSQTARGAAAADEGARALLAVVDGSAV